MNSGRSVPPKEKVLRLIKAAFPGIPGRPDSRPLVHAECVEMRSRLPMLTAGELPGALREVLVDLLDTHTGTFGDGEDAEALVQYLNVPGRGVDLTPLRERYGEEWWARHLEEEKMLTQSRMADFQNFTMEQARAICAFLEHAKAWPEMEMYRGEIIAALEYWRCRAECI